MIRSADISPCGTYRYALRRDWDITNPRVVWIMLNPSTADAEVDDPTIRRCIEFSKREGYGGLVVVNLYAYRSTDPDILKKLPPGVARGPENLERLHVECSRALAAIVAWGKPGGRNYPLCIPHDLQLRCLGVNKDGSPRHPLYLAGDTPLVRWQP